MKLISDFIKLEELQSYVEKWLDTVIYTHIDDDLEEVEVTNRAIFNLSEKPEGWFNPFLMTVEELDEMRKSFTGGFRKWQRWIQEKIPFLDAKGEGRKKRDVNKERDIRLCGTVARARVNPLTRKLKKGIWRCKRRDCPKCNARKERKLLERMALLIGQHYTIITPEQAKVLVKEHGANSLLCKPIDKERILVVNNKGIGDVFTSEVAIAHAKVPPAGKNISGNLGKNSGVSPATAEDEAGKTVEVSCAEFVIDASRDEMDEVEKEYDEEVKSIQPDKMEGLQRAVYQCENILQRIVKDKGLKIFFLYRTKYIIKEKEFLEYASTQSPVPS